MIKNSLLFLSTIINKTNFNVSEGQNGPTFWRTRLSNIQRWEFIKEKRKILIFFLVDILVGMFS